MNRVLASWLLATLASLAAGVSLFAPRLLDDHNKFFVDFVNYNLLSILGVILAITLASASQMHLKFNDIEERIGKPVMVASRKEIKSSAICLLLIFATAIVLVAIKPILVRHHSLNALINSSAMLLLLFDLLILADFTLGVFSIQPLMPPSMPQALPVPGTPPAPDALPANVPAPSEPPVAGAT